MKVFYDIVEWAKLRYLTKSDKKAQQMLKLTEEVGELASDIARGNNPKDSIGDCVVVLTILAAQCNLDIVDCIYHAYDEIKDRKGTTKNGVFIKEGEN